MSDSRGTRTAQFALSVPRAPYIQTSSADDTKAQCLLNLGLITTPGSPVVSYRQKDEECMVNWPRRSSPPSSRSPGRGRTLARPGSRRHLERHLGRVPAERLQHRRVQQPERCGTSCAPASAGRPVRVQLTSPSAPAPSPWPTSSAARRTSGSSIDAATDRVVTFGGQQSVTIPVGAGHQRRGELVGPASSDLAVVSPAVLKRVGDLSPDDGAADQLHVAMRGQRLDPYADRRDG